MRNAGAVLCPVSLLLLLLLPLTLLVLPMLTPPCDADANAAVSPPACLLFAAAVPPQGPFPDEWMRSWVQAGHLSMDREVRSRAPRRSACLNRYVPRQRARFAALCHRSPPPDCARCTVVCCSPAAQVSSSPDGRPVPISELFSDPALAFAPNALARDLEQARQCVRLLLRTLASGAK